MFSCFCYYSCSVDDAEHIVFRSERCSDLHVGLKAAVLCRLVKPGDVSHIFCGRPANTISGWPSSKKVGTVRILFISIVDKILTLKVKDKRIRERGLAIEGAISNQY